MMVFRVLIFVLAAGAAGAAAWLASQPGPKEPQAPVVTAAEIPTSEVLVAASDITSGEILSPETVRWQEWPESNLNDQFITRQTRPKAVAELSGTFVNTPFVAGEPIRQARLMETNLNLLSNKLAPGMRAVGVKISAENTAGGFILPGDRVDVIRTISIGQDGGRSQNESQIIITNARVLAIDQTDVQTPDGTVLGKTATLELAPAEAELIMAAEASGMLSLALRAVSDHAETASAETERSRTVRIHRATQTSTVTLR